MYIKNLNFDYDDISHNFLDDFLKELYQCMSIINSISKSNNLDFLNNLTITDAESEYVGYYEFNSKSIVVDLVNFTDGVFSKVLLHEFGHHIFETEKYKKSDFYFEMLDFVRNNLLSLDKFSKIVDRKVDYDESFYVNDNGLLPFESYVLTDSELFATSFDSYFTHVLNLKPYYNELLDYDFDDVKFIKDLMKI